MPFPYRYICDLLQDLDDESHKDADTQTPASTLIQHWFRKHRSLLDVAENDAGAILSTLLPERRTDRVYGIQTRRLESIFGKAQLLGSSRVQELRLYTKPGHGLDLGDCVERVLRRSPNPSQDHIELTVEEIDGALGCIAAACRFSSPAVRALPKATKISDQDGSLANFYRRLSPRDAKWFTRLVLKNYQPVVLHETTVFRAYHVLLPQMLKVRDDLSLVTGYLKHASQTPDNPGSIARFLKPCIGTKVGRQTWLKGRSIKNCVDISGRRQMSCEQKIDGEYCQIHIDLRKPQSCIQIFSKSGKDSTWDRVGLHQPILDSLRIGKPDCPFQLGCILEGELVVYSTKENKILPFHKIRKHVSRSGSFLGTAKDSQPHSHEHLMIIYYDVLLIDHESLLSTKHSDRASRLNKLITCRKGYAELIERQNIVFSRPTGLDALRKAFAKCIVSREEGLVLKPDEPYFDFSIPQERYGSCNIKLKKEYIQGWGDVGDFAVVGASYDAAKAREYKIPGLRWTHFFIGCLENKAQVRARIEKPLFRITNVVELPPALLSTFWSRCRPTSVDPDENRSIDIVQDARVPLKYPTVTFLEPPVFDMRCFAFDKEPNTNFWSMRFPMVSKIHYDRNYWDAITFSELQEAAIAAVRAPEANDTSELRRWVGALEKANPHNAIDDSSSQGSYLTELTTSPCQSPERAREKSRKVRCAADEENLESDKEIHSDTRDPLTTAGSSAIEPHGDLPYPPKPAEGGHQGYGCAKRPADEWLQSKSPAKRPCRVVDGSSTQSPVASPVNALSPKRPRCRQPLTQIEGNLPGPRNAGHRTMTPTRTPASPGLPTPRPTMASTGIAPPPSPAHLTQRAQPVAAEHQCHTSGTPTRPSLPCSYIGSKCNFTNCSFLLAPCIATYPWITEDLLGGHGIKTYLVGPDMWVSASAERMAGSGRTTESTVRKRRRVRKVCLVESRRKKPMEDFLKEIERAGLRTRNGQRDWVEVYDWRILEDITAMESHRKLPRAFNPWRKHWVGLA
ncbi:hypothetical protein F4780DRAFT_715191 [Xylariomycetidae sp. FL0641]|nr:hypothetical protein F4780DRAFT_715191 [Xylariomycetidae sp. FL0641]